MSQKYNFLRKTRLEREAFLRIGRFFRKANFQQFLAALTVLSNCHPSLKDRPDDSSYKRNRTQDILRVILVELI